MCSYNFIGRSHRGLISDLLTPLGVVEAQDAHACLNMVADFTPNIFLIDRLMPGMEGPALSKKLRQIGFTVPIIMVTANANEDTIYRDDNINPAYNDYLIKPIRLEKYLHLTWYYEQRNIHITTKIDFEKNDLPCVALCKHLTYFAQIGHLSQLKYIAEEITAANGAHPEFIKQLKSHIKTVRFNKIIDLVQVSVS